LATPRVLLAAALAALTLGGTGCSSLRYKETHELWRESDAHFDAGRYDEAVPYYDELLRREEYRAQTLRGVAEERMGDDSSASSDYAEAGSRGEARAQLYLANLHIRNGAYDLAEQDLAALRGLSLGTREQLLQLTLVGTLRLEQGNPRLAAQSLERAAQLGASYRDGASRKHLADAHYNASAAYYQLGDFGRAYSHLERYAELSPPSAEDSYHLGLLAYLAGDFGASEAHLQRADPALVSQARATLDDPSFGATVREGSYE